MNPTPTVVAKTVATVSPIVGADLTDSIQDKRQNVIFTDGSILTIAYSNVIRQLANQAKIVSDSAITTANLTGIKTAMETANPSLVVETT